MKRWYLFTAAVLCMLLLVSGNALAAGVRPREIHPEDYDLNNGEYLLGLKDLDRIAEEEWFTAALYVRPAYDAVQVEALAPGDTLWVREQAHTVEDVIPAGPDDPGIVEVYLADTSSCILVSDKTGGYNLMIDDWFVVEPVGEVRVTLPLPQEFSYVEYADGEDNQPEGAQSFLFRLPIWGKDFLPYNTRCTMKDGQLVYVFRTSYPYGPEDEYFVEQPPAANAGYAWTEMGENEGPATIQELYGMEPYSTDLEDAFVLCFRKDALGNLSDTGHGAYMGSFYRGLAMYGTLMGKVDNPPDTGESLVCIFLDPEGNEMMSMQLWNGYVVDSGDLYVYCP